MQKTIMMARAIFFAVIVAIIALCSGETSASPTSQLDEVEMPVTLCESENQEYVQSDDCHPICDVFKTECKKGNCRCKSPYLWEPVGKMCLLPEDCPVEAVS